MLGAFLKSKLFIFLTLILLLGFILGYDYALLTSK